MRTARILECVRKNRQTAARKRTRRSSTIPSVNRATLPVSSREILRFLFIQDTTNQGERGTSVP